MQYISLPYVVRAAIDIIIIFIVFTVIIVFYCFAVFLYFLRVFYCIEILSCDDDDMTMSIIVFVVNGRFEIKEEDGTHTLLVKDLKLADAADFTCKIGDRETSAKLQVDEGIQ